jgi:regulator of sirC expression with transglutaminase-like and TPR domain
MRATAKSTNHVTLLTDILGREGERLDPAYAALLLARPFYPELDLRACLAEVDLLAASARSRLGRARSPHRVISAINAALFEEAGYYGNTQDFYDPRNSFLNEVLDRKTGIPIALSALYMAVARRLKQPIVGVGLPLHYVVKYVGDHYDFYIDPFNGGEVLTEDQCRARVQQAYGAPVKLEPELFAETPLRPMLYRMLNNLKFAFLKVDDFERAGIVIELMLAIFPHRTEELRDRGLLYMRERKWSAASGFLERYLRQHADAPDAGEVQQQLALALDHRARRN